MNLPSIYIIFNKINLKIYIGSAVKYSLRLNSHRSKLNAGKHTNKHLQNAWNKYKECNFIFKQLEIVDDIEDLLLREQYYLDKLLFASDNNNLFYELGYNKVRIAGSNLGYKFSDESKKKLSDSHKNIFPSEATKQKMRESSKGEKNHFYRKSHTTESKLKMSNSRKLLNENIDFKNKILKALLKSLYRHILQFTLDGIFVKRWASLKEAGEILKIFHISDVCRKKRKSAGGYYWEYEKNYNSDEIDTL